MGLAKHTPQLIPPGTVLFAIEETAPMLADASINGRLLLLGFTLAVVPKTTPHTIKCAIK